METRNLSTELLKDYAARSNEGSPAKLDSQRELERRERRTQRIISIAAVVVPVIFGLLMALRG